MQEFTLFATCGAGIEAVLARELQDLGYDTRTENGRVYFKGNMADIAKTNIWLRTADRIKIEFGSFKATDFDTLFNKTYELDWQELLPMNANFPVKGRSIKSKLHSVPRCQAIVKKAIAQKLMDYYHRRTNLPETGETYQIEIEMRKDIATLTVDTSGESLFKRGYRVEHGDAPLRENMAAALIMLTTWFPDRPFYDPTTGSGTLAIEAALIGRNIAPGLYRSFSAEEWTFFDNSVWKTCRQDARSKINQDIELNILACDIDHKMIEIAKKNAIEAGVDFDITFKQMQVSDFVPKESHGILIANPPYGDRLNDKEYVENLYKQMGEIYRPMTTWSKYILTSYPDFEEHYGQKATKKRKLYNGSIRVDFYQYWASEK